MVARIQKNQNLDIEKDGGLQASDWTWGQHKLRFWSAQILAAIVCCASLPSSAWGDFVYCDVDGVMFDAVGIEEVSGSADEMFGQPTAETSAIVMPGFGFRASSIGSTDFHAGLLEMTIVAEPGKMFRGISLTEFGSYLNFGASANVLFHTSAFVEVGGEVFSSDGVFQTAGTGVGNWEQEFEFAFPETQSFRLVIDSQVLATSVGGDVAFIDQSGLAIRFDSISAVPEPDMFFLALVSAVLFGLLIDYRRTRSSAKQKRVLKPVPAGHEAT